MLLADLRADDLVGVFDCLPSGPYGDTPARDEWDESRRHVRGEREEVALAVLLRSEEDWPGDVVRDERNVKRRVDEEPPLGPRTWSGCWKRSYTQFRRTAAPRVLRASYSEIGISRDPGRSSASERRLNPVASRGSPVNLNGWVELPVVVVGVPHSSVR